jgi:hypothetical protein
MNLIHSRYVLGVMRGGVVLAGLWRRKCSFLLDDNLHHLVAFYFEIFLYVFIQHHKHKHKIMNRVSASLFFNGNRIRF